MFCFNFVAELGETELLEFLQTFDSMTIGKMFSSFSVYDQREHKSVLHVEELAACLNSE